MAQFDSAENIRVKSTDVMTGDQDRNRFLYYQLKLSMQQAKRIDIIVSFLMESGVRMVLKDLKSALNRGVSVRILTGNYLG
ncbi:MAG: NgoFVII family restriction endonuclease, partial [Lachnospiraceae bacterium]|nr:NgoFVII family restriction endonuclease [Lachnospiraceae bacterium]